MGDKMRNDQKIVSMTTVRVPAGNKKGPLVALLRFERAVPLVEIPALLSGVNRRNKTEIKLLDPKLADRLLTKTDRYEEMADYGKLNFIVNVMIGYEAPGQRLGSEIVHVTEKKQRVVLSTGKHNGAPPGTVLVVRDITAEDIDGKGTDVRIVVPDDRMVVVRNFPAKDGWYNPHVRTTIPHGKAVDDELVKKSGKARWLSRKYEMPFVCFVTRSYHHIPTVSHDYYGRLAIGAETDPTWRRKEMVVQIPEQDIESIHRSIR